MLHSPNLRIYLCFVFLAMFSSIADAAVFDGHSGLTIDDSNESLSWKPANNAFSVYCWFKISVPSGEVISENMTILVDRKTGDDSSHYTYLIRYNVQYDRIEFLSNGDKGSTGEVSLIEHPYLDRWYHVAVVRSGDTIFPYIDGIQKAESISNTSIGDSNNVDGVSIGCWNESDYFYGEIQEVAIFQSSIGYLVEQLKFLDLPSDYHNDLRLAGYYKLSESDRDLRYRNTAIGDSVASDTMVATKVGSGKISVVDNEVAAEQSLFDANKNGGENAIVPLSGAFVWGDASLERPTPGIPFRFSYSYSSANATVMRTGEGILPIVMTPGWRHEFEMRMIPTQISSERRIIMDDGSIQTWERDGDVYKTRDKRYRGQLVRLANGDYKLTAPDHTQYYFYDPTYAQYPWDQQLKGRLYKIEDYNGNKIEIAVDGFLGRVDYITDSAGLKYEFSYNSQNYLEDVNCFDMSTFEGWSVHFEYADNHLASIWTASSGDYTQIDTTKRFEYNEDGLLYKVFEPNCPVAAQTITYDGYDRMTKVEDALGNVSKFEYGKPEARQITRTDPEKNKWIETYDAKHRLLESLDPNGNTTEYTYDEAGNVISETDAKGNVTTHTYDDRSNKTSTTNVLGHTSMWEYHDTFNKVIKATDPAGWEVYYEYDPNGLLTDQNDQLGDIVKYTYYPNGKVKTATDGNGNVENFLYNSSGFLQTYTDANGYQTNYDYNALGWKTKQINALGEETLYSYDLNGNTVCVEDALGRRVYSHYDPRGNLVESIDPNGFVTQHEYDYLSQRIKTIDPCGAVTQYSYTPLGKLETITDPCDYTVTNTYDELEQLVKITDANNFTITFEYDENGNEIGRTNQLGEKWTKQYDALDRVIAQTDPLGNTVRTAYDEVGRMHKTTSAKGYSSINEYDGRGRLIKWIDPQGYQWTYEYDGVGNIVDITDANGGHYAMLYSPRNERTYERNQDGDEWLYTYDAIKRLKTSKTPDNVIRTYTYDPAGRITDVSYSTGRLDTYEYDLNSNVVSASRNGSGVLLTSSFTYDQLNRVTSSTDTHGFTVGYGYDLLGRRTKLTYPGNKEITYEYDKLGRLTGHTDWAGRKMDYIYDKMGKLISKKYPNGVEQMVQYDQSNRLTDLAFASSGSDPFLAYEYAYDKNGNVSSSEASGLPIVETPAALDATFRHTAANKMVDKQDAADSSNSYTYTYDENGNLTEANSPAQSYALVYDEDNRVVSIDWQKDSNAVNVQNTYDIAGGRLARTQDGIETRYVLDLSRGIERILCDVDDSNAVTKYYVYGNGVLAYSIDSSEETTSYHSDASGNIAALTDPNGNVVAQYVYSPYGRILTETGTVSNPYKFAGSVGIMEELPDLYFMRARYYSSDACRFLSTDPLKNIGPGWRPSLYEYARGNPLTHLDEDGGVPVLSYVAAFGIGVVKGAVNAALVHTALDALFDDETADSLYLAYLGLDIALALDPTHHGRVVLAGQAAAKFIGEWVGKGLVLGIRQDAKSDSDVDYSYGTHTGTIGGEIHAGDYASKDDSVASRVQEVVDQAEGMNTQNDGGNSEPEPPDDGGGGSSSSSPKRESFLERRYVDPATAARNWVKELAARREERGLD